MEIYVEKKTVYGNTLYYPACWNAKTFCRLTNQKTLSLGHIRDIKVLGFKVLIRPDEVVEL